MIYQVIVNQVNHSYVTTRRRRSLCATAAVLASMAAGPALASAATDAPAQRQWNLRAIHVAEAHRVTLGAGATVAVVDSGVDRRHPDLAGRVVSGPDLVDGDADADDESGHGTHVAGIIAARGGNPAGSMGVAPGATILAVRVLGATLHGDTSQEARGIDAAVAGGAQVINLSLSAGPDAPKMPEVMGELTAAIERAARAGVVVVTAAGNYNLPWCAQPVLAVRTLCVGSVDRAGRRASYSNYGARVNVMAPGGGYADGEAIVSTRMGGGYTALVGTSQAAPHVAAVAALLVSLGLRGEQVVDRIERTATDLGPAGLDGVFGHGLVDAGAAVAGYGRVDMAAEPRAAVFARAPRHIRVATVLQRGLAVRCRASVAGRCTARVSATSGRLLARGTVEIRANATRVVTARLTATGRRLLRRSARIRSTLRVSVRGADAVRRRVVFVR
ncbi:MAG: thermitase [Solirubrobacteraceae bacterium]|nr:thermitase [Solirubrobacteraceae bacterium]